MSEPRPGRRIRRVEETFGWQGLLRGSVLALVALALLAVASLPGPVGRTVQTEARTSTASQRQLVCPTTPAPGLRGGAPSTLIGMLPGVNGGSVSSGEEPIDLAAAAAAPIPGAAEDAEPRVFIATGPSTRGLHGSVTQGTGAVGSCASPRASWWFVGAGAGPDHHSTLEVVNPRRTPAVVDITVSDTAGPVESPGLRGIQLRSGETKRFALAEVAPSTEQLAVHVRTTLGLVTADLIDHRVVSANPDSPVIGQWLSAQPRPATRVVLGGTPDRAAGDGTLLLANPQDSEATVSFDVSDESGSFRPEGQEPLSVGANSVLAVPLENYAGRTFELVSDKPIVAGLTARLDGRSLFHAATLRPSTGSLAAMVPSSPVAAVARLTAPDSAVSGTLTQLDREGQTLDTDEVSIEPGVTWSKRLDVNTRQIEFRTEDSVLGAVATRTGAHVGALAMLPVSASLRVPNVRPAG